MRWFFALNEASTSFWDYANLVQVAVHTARRHTTLEPVCLYDGTDNVLTAWLEDAGVTIVRCHTFLQQWVPDLPPIPRGTYLRLEIPSVCEQMGWDDTTVLYTDCDIYFRQDPVPLLGDTPPAYFAVAPEGDQRDYANFNAGIMWINVHGLASEQATLREFIHAHLDDALSPPYDQAILQRHFADRIDHLPLALNWKPYWGTLAEAAIVHFHGPKPGQKYLALNRRLPPGLDQWASPDYYAACAEWDTLLTEALHQRPWPEDVAVGIADGFDHSVAEITDGLGVPEPARPEAGMPASRWGLAPQTTLRFTIAANTAYRLEAVLQCSFPDQAVDVRLDGKSIAHLALTRLNDPYPVSIDLPAVPGAHEISFHYAQAHQPPAPDPRQLGALFRALRVREV